MKKYALTYLGSAESIGCYDVEPPKPITSYGAWRPIMMGGISKTNCNCCILWECERDIKHFGVER